MSLNGQAGDTAARMRHEGEELCLVEMNAKLWLKSSIATKRSAQVEDVANNPLFRLNFQSTARWAFGQPGALAVRLASCLEKTVINQLQTGKYLIYAILLRFTLMPSTYITQKQQNTNNRTRKSPYLISIPNIGLEVWFHMKSMVAKGKKRVLYENEPGCKTFFKYSGQSPLNSNSFVV